MTVCRGCKGGRRAGRRSRCASTSIRTGGGGVGIRNTVRARARASARVVVVVVVVAFGQRTRASDCGSGVMSIGKWIVCTEWVGDQSPLP